VQTGKQVKETEKNESAIVVLWIYATQPEDRKNIVSGECETANGKRQTAK